MGLKLFISLTKTATYVHMCIHTSFHMRRWPTITCFVAVIVTPGSQYLKIAI